MKRTVVTLLDYYQQIPGQVGVSLLVKEANSLYIFTETDARSRNRGVKQTRSTNYTNTDTKGRKDAPTPLLESMAPSREHFPPGWADLEEEHLNSSSQRAWIVRCRADPSYSTR